MRVAIIDFETTGLSPEYGDRATEVAVVIVQDGQITDTFQSLMNPGRTIPRYVQELTGISNAMIKKAAPSRQVIAQMAEFIGDTPLVAHNASFDRKFLHAEMAYIHRDKPELTLCSLLLSRRLYPDAPNHKLGTLVRYLQLESGRAHRALADAMMTAHLWNRIHSDLQNRYQFVEIPLELLQRLQQLSKAKVHSYIANYNPKQEHRADH